MIQAHGPLPPPPPGTGAIIFDFDGTLVDSAALNFRAMRYALAWQNIPLSWPWFIAHAGLSDDDALQALASSTGLLPDRSAVEARRARYVEDHLGELTVHRCVAALAQALYGQAPLAVGTGNSAALVTRALRALRLNEMFEAVVGREHVRRGKPAPDIFRAAAEALGTPAAAVHVYEDTDEGLAAAAAAGMRATDVRPYVRQPAPAGPGSPR